MSLFRTTHQIRFLALSVQRQWKCFTAQSLVHRLYPIKCMDLPQSRSPSSSLKAGANSVVRSLAVTDARKEVDAFGNLAEKDVLQISYSIFCFVYLATKEVSSIFLNPTGSSLHPLWFLLLQSHANVSSNITSFPKFSKKKKYH